MSSNWIGCIVSIDCGDTLGTYQGQVKGVNDGAQTLTLAGAFRNGLQCEVREITLSAADIKFLKILMSPGDAHLVTKQSTPSKLTNDVREEAVEATCKTSHVELTRESPCQTYYNRHPSPQNGRSLMNYVNGTSYRLSPANIRPEPVVKHHGSTNGLNHSCPNGSFPNLTNGNGAAHRHTPTKDEHHRPRRNSTSDVKKKSTTPRKIEFKRRGTPKDECFSAPSEGFMDEFDFESNLALFDKKAIYEEIENCGKPELVCADDKHVAKYRCDENVLQSGPLVLKQISVPSSEGVNYVTDSGLVVPSISYEMRQRLLVSADQCGLGQSRLLEMVGRSATEMVLQLLGGSHRMAPQNDHQRPVVVVLCGPHGQGAQGVNCARQLANHNVQTTVFVPTAGSMHRHSPLEQELKLYELTGNNRTYDVRGLPSGTVDMILTAIDSHEEPGQSSLREQSWHQTLVAWATQKKAPVLAVDPPVEGASIPSKWSLGLGLPLNLRPCCGQLYLCDLSLPKKVFADVGIQYMSPFGHKYIIPLHAKC